MNLAAQLVVLGSRESGQLNFACSYDLLRVLYMCRSKVLLIWSMVEVDEGERLASRCGGMVSKRT